MGNARARLEVCIPVYKRTHGSLRAAESVLAEIERSSLSERVSLRIVDDYSENGTYERLAEHFLNRSGVTVCPRESNFGMSRNIKSILEESTAEYAMILTDDDWLEEGALATVISAIDGLFSEGSPPSLIFPPRHCYLEDGTLQGTVCDPYPETRSIPPSLVNAATHCMDGYVLSGLVLKTQHIDFRAWERYVENGYFPVIVTAGVLSKHPGLFLKAKIVHHTVLNVCHWESWGSTRLQQSIRLHLDIFSALDASSSCYYEESPLKQRAFVALSLPGRSRSIAAFAANLAEWLSADGEPVESAAHAIKRLYQRSYANRIAFAVAVTQTARAALKYALLSKLPSPKSMRRRERALGSFSTLRTLWRLRPSKANLPTPDPRI